MVRQKPSMIGLTTHAEISGRTRVPTKVDPSIDSVIWASNIQLNDDGTLSFSLFGPESPYYTGEITKRAIFQKVFLTDADGRKHAAYRTYLTLNVGGRHIRSRFILADLAGQPYPIILGRHTLKNRFYIKVTPE